MYTMKESVAVAKEADAKKGVSPTRSDNSIQRLRNEPERQLGSLRDVIGNIRRDGGTPSVESIATELSNVPTAQRAPALLALQQTHGNQYVQRVVAGIPAKLKVGQPGDIYEQEADRVADEVMRMQEPQVQRQMEEEETFQTKEVPDLTPEVTPNLESRINVLREGGQPLPDSVRVLFEPFFGHDFSRVRVHTNTLAAETAQTLNARAFTFGRDVVFGAGQYAPGTTKGQQLLAHELTHVVQQGDSTSQGTSLEEISTKTDPLEREAERVAKNEQAHPFFHSVLEQRPQEAPAQTAQRLYRATFNVGSVTVQIDYGNVVRTPPNDYESAIEVRFASWTGSPASIIHADLTSLTLDQKRWLLFALDVLVDNTTSAHGGLNRVDAVQRLIAHVPSSTTRPLGTASVDFGREVLRVSGWFEVAQAAQLAAPTGSTLTTIGGIYNPPPGPTAPPSGVLDATRLRTELPPALTNYLNGIDPANWTATGTQQLSDLQNIGDLIQSEARSFFSPYADTAISNAYSRGWRYSSNLFSVTTMTPIPDTRITYLLNRAEIVGRSSRRGGSIFSNVNYESSRPADRAALLSIVTTMESNLAIQGVVNRLIQHTGRTQGPATTRRVGISTEFDLNRRTECQARWRTIYILSHELVHVLVHPNFPATASNIDFGQIVREGFTEVLGNQLHNHRLRPKGASNLIFKAQMESGIAGAPCPAPAAVPVGYRQAGASAERIRGLVGNDNFRAAYFLGATHLVGL